jgi:subfamily B ATP-binding cassette protein MsbA
MLKQFFKVLARYMAPYKLYIVGAVLLNIFSQWMNVFSFVVLIPILNILFKIDQTVYHYQDCTWSTLNKEVIVNNG